MRRTLTLKRERLAELSNADLAEVIAGQQPLPTVPVDQCLGMTDWRTTCNCCTGSASC
jgi:hypothetical protein